MADRQNPARVATASRAVSADRTRAVTPPLLGVRCQHAASTATAWPASTHNATRLAAPAAASASAYHAQRCQRGSSAARSSSSVASAAKHAANA